MKRRDWIAAGGIGALAAAGGVAWNLRQGAGPAAPSEVPADDPAGLWSRRFEKPSGGELAMADLRGKPLVLNFWATWCPPCVKEMPELDRFHRTYAGKGWQVVGLAIDGPTPVREFLVRVPVGFTIGLAGFEGTDLGRQLGNDKGGLPFTVLFDRRGAVVRRKLGETNFDELSRWAEELAT